MTDRRSRGEFGQHRSASFRKRLKYASAFPRRSPPRFVQVTDPLGNNEREEWLEPAPIPDSDPAATVPVGMSVSPTNSNLTYRDSFHWDKSAYVLAGCSPSGGCDYTKARIRHFAHDASNINQKSTCIESVKYPNENRVWFNYPGQTASFYSGTYTKPIAAGRVLDDGTTQLSQTSYDTAGYYKVTQTIDPVGRTTSYSYSNHIDLAAISQTTVYGNQQTVAQLIYNIQHRPIFSTDAAGQTTAYTYNAAGQPTSITNPLSQKTSYQYNTTGDLTVVTNANNATAASFMPSTGSELIQTRRAGQPPTTMMRQTGQQRSHIPMERRDFTLMTSSTWPHSRIVRAGCGSMDTMPIGA
jgi:YD repeat-containing protein